MTSEKKEQENEMEKIIEKCEKMERKPNKCVRKRKIILI